MDWHHIASMPLASPFAYPEQPQAQPQQSSPPPGSPTQDIALARSAARRGRGNLNARLRQPCLTQTKTRAERMNEELFFPPDVSASGLDQAGSRASTTLGATASSANATSSVRAHVSASRIAAFAATDLESSGAFTLPRLSFQGDSRRLKPACEVALRQQYDRLTSLRRQAEQYMLDIDRSSDLKAELVGMGVDIEVALDKVLERCDETMNSIAQRTAQSRIPVAENPTAAWVASKMMHSAESRKELVGYLQKIPAGDLGGKYRPVRDHLHQMREDIQQLLRRKQCSRAEQQQLRVFAKQVQETLDDIQNVEYHYTWLQIEQGHAGQQTPHIPYSPEAAVSLDTRIAFYSAQSVSPPGPAYPHDMFRQSENSQQRHRRAYQTYQHQLSVQQATGAAIHPKVIADLQSASRVAETATARYRTAETLYRQEFAQWQELDAAAQKNQALKKLTESVQYTMLDDKVNTLMNQGFETLSDAPEPKPKAGEIDKLRKAYLAQQLTTKIAFLDKA